MTRRFSRIGWIAVCSVCFLAALPGCFGNNSLPPTVTIDLPDGSQTQATLGSGVIALANTTWDFFRVANNAQGISFVTVRFGPAGNLERFDDNTIASSIFGSTILFDGQRHDTSQPGLQYAAATFGAETSDSMGFAFQARLTGFIAGIEGADATATATAEFDPNDPNVVTGTFTFTSRVTLLDIPEGNIDDEFSFRGERVVEP